MKNIKSNLKFVGIFNNLFYYRGNQILGNLTKLTNIAIDIFQKSFFDSDNNNDNLINSLSPGRNILDASTIQTLQNRLFKQLGNWFSFIEVRAQANITISLFVFNDFF